ncbi:MAG: universal stress protein [Pseudonocardia sp.]|nr:universal stress protein [Pseudonocardia sp.]
MNAMHAGPIVVGVDDSEPARDAVRWAAAEAARVHAPLRLVSSLVLPSAHHLGNPGMGTTYQLRMTEAAHAVLNAAVGLAERTAPGVAVESELLTGFPDQVLLDESRRASLVVVGSRGLGGFTGLLLGSVAVALASRGTCPVVVVRGTSVPTELPDARPVVVGVDGSPTSEAALAFAFDAASRRGVPLVAVHTWLDDMLDPTLAPVIDWTTIETDERALLGERLAGWGAKFPDVEVRRLVVRDRPARTLVDESVGAQLVVVGSRGRGGMRGLVMGSVAQAVLRHSHCPVAVARPPAPDA